MSKEDCRGRIIGAEEVLCRDEGRSSLYFVVVSRLCRIVIVFICICFRIRCSTHNRCIYTDNFLVVQ